LETNHWPAVATGYELDGPIGQGSYGLVWKAVCKDKNSQNNNKEVAIKIVDLELF
jgi:serine/threonine protein kinase